MTGDIMVFAALVATPASSFLCGYSYLLFFLVFPLGAILEKRPVYFRNLALIAAAPSIVFVWGTLSGHYESTPTALRWICAVSGGVYFAGALGPRGIASVLGQTRRFSPAARLSETMMLAGGAASSAKDLWKKNSDLPLSERIAATLKDALLSEIEPAEEETAAAGAVAISVAVVSWLFLLASVAGRAG